MKRRVLSVLLATVALGSTVLSAGCSGKQDAKETLTVFNYGNIWIRRFWIFSMRKPESK